MGWFSDFFSDPFSTVVDTVTDNVVPVITAGAQLATGNVAGAALTVGSTIAKNTGGGDTFQQPPPLAKTPSGLGLTQTQITQANPSEAGMVQKTQPVVYIQPPTTQSNYTPIILAVIGVVVLSRVK